MNICLFTSSFLPNVGGMEMVVDTLAKKYRAMGHRVVVLAKTPRKMKTPPVFDYPVYYYKRSRSEVFFLGAPKKMLKKLHKEYHFDIIHAHQMYPTGWLAVRFGEKNNIPVVLTSHAGDVVAGSKYRKSRIKCHRMIDAMKRADVVTGVGTGVCMTIDELIGAKKALYIPNGCSAPEKQNVTPALRQKLDLLGLQSGFDLSVGRLHPAKGLFDLVNAYRILKEKNITVPPFVMAGSGTCGDELSRLIREYGLEQQIFMIGAVNQQERDYLLSRCRFFMQPSHREGMPLTVLESMAAGAPVIGTDIPGIREILQDGINGRLVPPGDPEKLAKVIASLNDELRKNFAVHAADVLQTMSWEKIAQRYLDIFKSL